MLRFRKPAARRGQGIRIANPAACTHASGGRPALRGLSASAKRSPRARPPAIGAKVTRTPAMRPARKTLRRPDDLVTAGLLPPERRAEIEAVAARYALALTSDIAKLIDPMDPHDPVARQFVPDPAELEGAPEERADPIGDEAHSPLEGIVHRYPDRVLLKPVHVCAAYCRFCFRREVVGNARALSRQALDAALGYIRTHGEIWEVILSGGDPLVLAPRRLAAIVEALAAIDHVRVIRVHTRVPVAAPARVTPRSEERRVGKESRSRRAACE